MEFFENISFKIGCWIEVSVFGCLVVIFVFVFGVLVIYVMLF